MKTASAPLMTGLVAMTAILSALSLGACGPDAGPAGAELGIPTTVDGLWQATVAGVGSAGGVVTHLESVDRFRAASSADAPIARRAVVALRVDVRMDDGSTRSFERPDIGALAIGTRVQVQGRQLIVS
jgi:hypothetical protein